MSDTIPWWAFPGNKVVCVEMPDPLAFFGDEILPVVGETYTIRAVTLYDGMTPCLLLQEISNTPRHYTFGHYEGAFRVIRFRPVVSDSGELETAFYYGKNRHAKQPRKEPA